MPFPVETFSRTPQPRRLSNRPSARGGGVVDQRPARQALPGGRHRPVKMLGAESGGNRAGATGGPPGCSSGDPSCEPRRSSVSFAIRIPSKHVLRETDNRGPRCSDGRGVARVGHIDQGIRRRSRYRHACGFFPNSFAIFRWVVWPRRLAIPQRMPGAARAWIPVYFCHPQPVNG
jgi:hypothetical protein